MQLALKKKLSVSAAALIVAAGVQAPTIADAAIFEFNQQGYSDGGVFSGFFEAEDLDGNGQIESFAGEVTDFVATYQSGLVGFQQYDFGSLQFPANGELTGLVYSLDGRGTIGDDQSRAIEGLAVANDDSYIAVGPGPFNFCDGTSDCGQISSGDFFFIDEEELVDDDFFVPEIFATTSEILNVTSGPLGDAFGSPDRPFLPDDDGNDSGDGFVFTIFPDEISPFETFFIDPVIAVGYTYEVNGSEFNSVTAPTFAQVPDADGKFILNADGVVDLEILAGVEYTFASGVTSFTLTGIDAGLELDPLDPLAFITGVSLTSAPLSSFTVTQTPITFDTDAMTPVPLPAGGLLMLTGLAGFGLARRRKQMRA